MNNRFNLGQILKSEIIYFFCMRRLAIFFFKNIICRESEKYHKAPIQNVCIRIKVLFVNCIIEFFTQYALKDVIIIFYKKQSFILGTQFPLPFSGMQGFIKLQYKKKD